VEAALGFLLHSLKALDIEARSLSAKKKKTKREVRMRCTLQNTAARKREAKGDVNRRCGDGLSGGGRGMGGVHTVLG
jgi:hypothetical protein